MDNSYKQKKDWEIEFDSSFIKDLGDEIEPVWKDPVGCVGPVKDFISSLIDETEKQCEHKWVGNGTVVYKGINDEVGTAIFCEKCGDIRLKKL